MILGNKTKAESTPAIAKLRGEGVRPLRRVRETRVSSSNHLTLQRSCACGGTCDECGKKQLEYKAISGGPDGARTVQQQPAGVSGWAPPFVHKVLRSPGEALDAATRAYMEPRFGQDFSRIRVHTDAEAAESARAVRAIAYTVGRDIVFATGHYAPGTTAGRHLLAHELTHTLQQDFGARQPTLQRNDDFHLPEAELKLPPKRKPSLFKPGKEPHLHVDFCWDTILAEGTCKDLALGSKYICCDPVHGFKRPGRKTSVAEPGKTCASERFTPIFTCDNKCETALRIGCDDNDHWMAAPGGTFKRSQCGQTFTICTSGRRTTGFIRDHSVTQSRFEVSPGIQKALGVKVGDSFQGKVYSPDTPESLISADPCCVPPRPELILQPGPLQPKLAVNQSGDEFEQEADRVASRVAGSQLPRATFSPSIDPRLAPTTPAWTENGLIRLSPYGLLLPAPQISRVLRHEGVHALHQGIAPRRESAAARMNAESLATRGEQASLYLTDFLAPVPGLLAFPPQPYKPWASVTLGHPGIVGEVVESGITVRIFKSYDDLGVKGSGAGYQNYECGKHDAAPIPEIVKKMRQVAQITAKFNVSIPDSAKKLRVALVAIFGDKSANAYRIAHDQGLIILSEEDFNSGSFSETLFHEASHAIFEFHSVAKGAESRKPDPLALRIADLYDQLSDTKAVPEPTAKFDPKKPPPLELSGKERGQAAGVVMVTDVLWAGEGGHPWHGVDEFFASAYGGYRRDPDLLKKIVAHYAKADPKIKGLAKELFALLDVAGDPAKAGKLKEPAKPEAAARRLAAVTPMLDETDDTTRLGWLIDPTRMPGPKTIYCPTSKPAKKKEKTIEELLEK